VSTLLKRADFNHFSIRYSFFRWYLGNGKPLFNGFLTTKKSRHDTF